MRNPGGRRQSGVERKKVSEEVISQHLPSPPSPSSPENTGTGPNENKWSRDRQAPSTSSVSVQPSRPLILSQRQVDNWGRRRRSLTPTPLFGRAACDVPALQLICWQLVFFLFFCSSTAPTGVSAP